MMDATDHLVTRVFVPLGVLAGILIAALLYSLFGAVAVWAAAIYLAGSTLRGAVPIVRAIRAGAAPSRPPR